LAAAQQLARAGHAVTLYERSDQLGGLLRYGIPDFKLEKAPHRPSSGAARGRRRPVRDRFCNVGIDVTGEQLRADHDAVLLTCGALDPRDVGDTPGRALAGIHRAMDYLEGSNRVVAGTLDSPPITAEGKHVIVLGGGDTAADCLGTAHRQGAASVHLIEVMPEPPAARDPARNPWPTWPVILRTALRARGGGHAHLRLGGAGVPRQSRRLFTGSESGRC
jgi:glutamate synthase (NADPH/NADH) small chain